MITTQVKAVAFSIVSGRLGEFESVVHACQASPDLAAQALAGKIQRLLDSEFPDEEGLYHYEFAIAELYMVSTAVSGNSSPECALLRRAFADSILEHEEAQEFLDGPLEGC